MPRAEVPAATSASVRDQTSDRYRCARPNGSNHSKSPVTNYDANYPDRSSSRPKCLRSCLAIPCLPAPPSLRAARVTR